MSDDQFEVVPALRREWLILVRRRRIIFLTVVIALVGCTVYNYTMRPVYQGHSVVAIGEAAASNPLSRMSVDLFRFRAILERQKAVIKGTDLANKVVAALSPSELRELSSGPIGSWTDRMTAQWNRWLGKEAPDTPKNASAALRSRLNVTSETDSTWLTIQVSAFDSEFASKVANLYLDTYIRETEENNNRSVDSSKKALGAQVEEKEQRLGEQLTGLREMGGRSGLGDVEVRKAMLEREYRAFQEALVNAQTSRVGNEARHKEATQLKGGVAAVRSDPLIRAASARVTELEDREATLLATLGPKHPDVVTVQQQLLSARQRLASELSALEQGADSEYQLALNEETRLKANMARIQKELNGVESESVAYSLERKKAEANRSSIEGLLQRQANAAPIIIDTQVIQNSRLPLQAVSPQRARNFGAALLGGLLLGVFFAWLADRFDESVQSPEDVRDGIGLAFLGIVPLIPKFPSGPIAPILADAKNALADSLRVVRTNLIYGTVGIRPKVVAVTSASPAEGKSTVASGLAILFAQNKAKVLLIDADLRRPSLHNIMGVPGTPGLSNLLASDAAINLATRSGPIRGLDVLPAGPPQTHSSERLGAEAMKALIEEARKQYDWVIVDCPPALGLPDAAIVATLADGILVVCSGDKTPRQAVRHVADQLKAVKATVLGVVLNRVNMNRHSYYYGRYYSPHYGVETDPGAGRKSGQDSREGAAT